MASGKKPDAGKKDAGKKPADAKKPAEGAEDEGAPLNQTEEQALSAIADALTGRKTFGEILGINAHQAYNMAQMGYRLPATRC